MTAAAKPEFRYAESYSTHAKGNGDGYLLAAQHIPSFAAGLNRGSFCDEHDGSTSPHRHSDAAVGAGNGDTTSAGASRSLDVLNGR